MVVLLMGLKMLVQMVDPLGKERDLNLGGTRVALVRRKFCNNLLLVHLCLSSYGTLSRTSKPNVENRSAWRPLLLF